MRDSYLQLNRESKEMEVRMNKNGSVETRVLFIGHDARGDAIVRAIKNSRYQIKLFAFMESLNPGVASLATAYELGKYDNPAAIVAYAKSLDINFAVISPEKPLFYGVVDALENVGIPCVGPTKAAAQIETSKSFTRELFDKYGIPGNPRYRVFRRMDSNGMWMFMGTLDQVVIKPDGLTGGKGVMVQGDHFDTKYEAMSICAQILKTHPAVVIEEKEDGEEFSLQFLVDGTTLVPTPPVQDHKRRFAGDKGSNTGGTGSYSDANHLLPFLRQSDIDEGTDISRQVVAAISKETGQSYRGVLYGGFMATKNGVKVIEYNARFGDPEAMNILPLLQTDFVDICFAIIFGQLHKLKVTFQEKATVCKYLVPLAYGRDLPEGHPDLASNSARIKIGDIGEAKLYYSSVQKRPDGIYTTASRSVAVVGIADDLVEAETIAEKAAQAIKGPVDHRKDVGTKELIEKRVKHMKELRGK